MSYIIYDYDRQRLVKRSDADRIQSITPIYQDKHNKYNEFFQLSGKLKKLSDDHPENCFATDIYNVPPGQYQNLKDDIGIGDEFTEHEDRFYYQVNINCVIAVHLQQESIPKKVKQIFNIFSI